MVTALLLMTVTRQLTEPQCIRTNQTFHHKFSVFECMKIIVQNYAQVSLPLSHTIQYSKMLKCLLKGTFSLEKWKSKWTLWFLCWRWWKAVLFVTFGILLYVAYRTLLVMFCVRKFYFVDFYGMFTSSPTWRLKMHVLCKVGKNIIFQNKTQNITRK